MPTDKLQTLLKQHGYSLTKPRSVVFELLFNKEPKTMHQLIKTSENKIDRATLYRTIDLFEKLGVVHRVSVGWKYKIELTDLFNTHHHHLHCTQCGQIFDLEDVALETQIDSLAAKASFAPSMHTLEIYGICQNCQS